MERQEAGGADSGSRGGRWSTAALVAVGLVSLFLVVFFGWYQFGHRAGGPIDMVRKHRAPGASEEIGERMEGFLSDKGVRVSTAFKPRWGAEEAERDVFIVSYVYEVGREAHWISWKVYPETKRVEPRDRWARELWNGKS